jgi:ribonuclease-3
MDTKFDKNNSNHVNGKLKFNNYNNFNTEDELQLSPDEIRDRILNEKNIPITEEFINGIFEKVGFDHKVKNLANFQTAMIHSSYLEENVSNAKTIKLLKDIPPIDSYIRKKCMPLQQHSYERLEFLGDSIIRHAFGKYLFLRYTNEEEGFLTTNRSKMENKFALSELARKLGIQNYAVIAKNIELANGRTSYVTLTEDLFEAFVGALNLEIDENRSVEFLWLIIEKELDVPETIRTQNNYKDKLMQHFHKIDVIKHDLHYEDEEIESDDGKKKYRTVVSDKNTGKKLGVGSGRSKKTSQQRAAKDALIRLGLIGNDVEADEYFDTNDVSDMATEIKKVRSSLASSIEKKEFKNDTNIKNGIEIKNKEKIEEKLLDNKSKNTIEKKSKNKIEK